MFKIPAHEEDFEVFYIFLFYYPLKVRVFLDRHVSDLNKKNNASFMLFSYEGDRITNPKEVIRACPYSERELLTDVFIFEASDTIEHYTLIILKSNNKEEEIEDETYFSLSVHYFILIKAIIDFILCRNRSD